MGVGKVAQATLGLEAGDKVDFMQDEDSAKDFYLRKIGGQSELRKASSSLCVVNTPFVRAVCDIYDVKPPFSMRVSEKPNDEGVYALIMEG
ncbi:MAG: hypothetical protein K2H70_03580 [Bacteroidales bacterium]|nr:hypothetical protein [Bacteroidales bacterium]